MIQRDAKNKILEMAAKFPVILLTGPRQSGKTTLCKNVFKNYRYVSLENPDNLEFAQNDPRGFLKLYDKYVIIDEAQNCPAIFSYIQQIIDESTINGQYIITGSQNFLLLQNITQSLAGRVYIMELLPFCNNELNSKSWSDAVVKGGYPRMYNNKIEPNDYFSNYIQTYIERDMRTLLNVRNLATFKKFVNLLAHHTGQLVNYNHLSKEVGVDVKTIQSWISILEAKFIVFTLKPWHNNFTKRLVKSPKLYFYDSGIPAFLLGITNGDDLITSNYKGALFENYAITEIIKLLRNQGDNRSLYFWRDSNGNEIDLIIERGKNVQLIEIKASETIKSEFIKSVHYLDNKMKDFNVQHYLFNTIQHSQQRTNETIVSWQEVKVINTI